MLILISPAKNLDLAPPPADLPRTAPLFPAEVKTLAAAAKKLKAGDLKRLMDISDKLAELNRERFKAFDPAAPPEAGKQAILTFNGDVYQGLAAKTLKPADLEWAQGHVRILSGLYGLLRPLDAIQPYRLEMGIKLANPKGEDLYDFWGAKLAKAADAALAPFAHKAVINLASEEYFSAIDRKTLKSLVITPVFQDVKNGKARSIFMFAKRARGLMTRYAIEKRIEDPDKLKRFSSGGYKFDPAASDEARWVFSRPQPAALS